MSDDALDIAKRLFSAIESGDVEAVRQLYDPAVAVWHNGDGVEQSADENLRVLTWVTKNVSGLRYEEVRCQHTDTGFVQQHVLRGTAPSGVAVEIPACLVATVAGGRITRIDEYLDSAH